MDDYDKIRESLYFQQWDVDNLLWMGNVTKVTCRWS